jgi:hypothetical protein
MAYSQLTPQHKAGARNPSTPSSVICYISPGSAKLTGGAPGLQIRCEAGKAVSGGFDSHALPPERTKGPRDERSGFLFWSGTRFIYILTTSATSVLFEMTKTSRHRGNELQAYVWRTSQGAKVAVVLSTGQGLVPIEVNFSATPRPPMADAITIVRRDLGSKATSAYVVHPGKVLLPRAARGDTPALRRPLTFLGVPVTLVRLGPHRHRIQGETPADHNLPLVIGLFVITFHLSRVFR